MAESMIRFNCGLFMRTYLRSISIQRAIVNIDPKVDGTGEAEILRWSPNCNVGEELAFGLGYAQLPKL
jgi:hypothetical protein